MSIENDTLLEKIDEQATWFKDAAKNHKLLNRSLWGVSTLLSISVALFANFDFTVWGVKSSFLTALFSIFLPVVTGYTVLRNPESLWILETYMRNRLYDLKQKLILAAEKNADFDRTPFEEEYFSIMGEANNKWRAIKENQGNS